MAHAPNNPLGRSAQVALVIAVVVALTSCASTGSIRTARSAEATQNYDVAVAEYTKLLRDNPGSREALQALCEDMLHDAPRGGRVELLVWPSLSHAGGTATFVFGSIR